MLKTFSLLFILFASSAAATPLPHFTPTPLPPQVVNSLNTINNANSVSAGCASNDCNDYHSTVRDKLPDPTPAAVEPAGGDKEIFCRDVNLEGVQELCMPTSLVGELDPAAGEVKNTSKRKHKRRHKRVIMGS